MEFYSVATPSPYTTWLIRGRLFKNRLANCRLTQNLKLIFQEVICKLENPFFINLHQIDRSLLFYTLKRDGYALKYAS